MPPDAASNNLLLEAESVRPTLLAFEGLADELGQQTQRLRAVLAEADHGDPRGYLDGGLNDGYEAAHLGGTAEAELRTLIRNANATITALEEHDRNVSVGTDLTILPVLTSVSADKGLTSIDPELTDATQQIDEIVDETGDLQNTFDTTAKQIHTVVPTTFVDQTQSTIQDDIAYSNQQLASLPVPAQVPTPPAIPASPQAEEHKHWWDRVSGWFKDRWNSLNEVLKGILKGVAEFAIALAKVALLALVITAILAALEVVAFTWEAFLAILVVVGIALLVASFIEDAINRFKEIQATHGDQPWYKNLWDGVKAVWVSFLDVTGITGIVEAINGTEIVSGRPLSPEERAEGATVGVLSIVSIFLGRAWAKREKGVPKGGEDVVPNKPVERTLLEKFGNDSERLNRVLKLYDDKIESLQQDLKLFDDNPARLEAALASFNNNPARLEAALAAFDNNSARLESALDVFGKDGTRLERALNIFDNDGAKLEEALNLSDNDINHLEKLYDKVKNGDELLEVLRAEKSIVQHPSAKFGEPSPSELREIIKRYPKADSLSEQHAIWLVEQQSSTAKIVAGERNCARDLDVPQGDNMVDIVQTQNSNLKVPIEVKNQKVIDLRDGTNAAFKKFQNIADHANMNQISHFEIIANEGSKLPPNFRVTKAGVLEELISGTNTWKEVTFGGKKVIVRKGPLGPISG